MHDQSKILIMAELVASHIYNFFDLFHSQLIELGYWWWIYVFYWYLLTYVVKYEDRQQRLGEYLDSIEEGKGYG